jgi:hypothetical protein
MGYLLNFDAEARQLLTDLNHFQQIKLSTFKHRLLKVELSTRLDSG